MRLGESEVKVSASFGVTASNNRTDVSLMALLQEADIAMYAAKLGGRNQVCIYDLAGES